MPHQLPGLQLIGSMAYCMAFAKGLDIEKCEDFVGFEELEGGDVTCGACQIRIED